MRFVIRMSSMTFATLLLSLLVFASQSVQAATLIVSTTADAGAGSLRQAIVDATSNAAANTINFNIPLADPGYDSATDRFTITLVNQLPDLPLAPLTIDNMMGRGVTVKGDSSFRIFTLVNSAVVNINNLTISQGSSSGGLGGGIYMGDSATLFLTGCIVSNNTATNGGGGIWVNDSGTLHVTNSTISNNTATNGDGGGIYINTSGTLNITSSTVSGNTATGGAADKTNRQNRRVVTRANIAAVGSGGGIYNGVSGTVNATNITVSGNSAGDLGGGILNNATATVNSSTISDNTATNGGGGMYNNFTATLNNSLVALNTGADGPDLLGRGSRGNPFTGNNNLIGNADGCEAFGPTTNQLGSTGSPINPRLGPLKDNGGPTFTQALLVGSPAIDAGATALATDQRGISRPQDGDGTGGAQSDIGSFEGVKRLTATLFDFTGDGKADLSVYTNSSNTWKLQDSATLTAAPAIAGWGAAGDILVPADYDGDRKADIAVFRPSDGNWYIKNSGGIPAASVVGWGVSGDRPVPGDYDADGKADFAVFRPSEGNWYVKLSGGSTSVVGWGEASDILVPGDYDGDARNDYAVYRPSEGNWYIRTNPAAGSETVILRNWGAGDSDRPVPADYDGDGKTDIAIYRPSGLAYYIINSATDTASVKSWGISGDVLVPADYDGDGKADIAVIRLNCGGGNQWWILKSSNNTVMDNGTPGVPPTVGGCADIAVPSVYISSPIIP